MQKAAGAAGRRLRPADRRAAPRDRDRPRRRLAARHLALADRRDALRRVRPAPGRDDLHLDQPVQGHPRGAAASSRTIRPRCRRSTSPARTARRCRSAAFASFSHKVEPLSVNHQGQFPAVTLSFNLAPGVALGQAVERIQAMRARPARCRRRSSGTLPGHGAGLPGLAVIDAAAGRRRDPGRLHRARHALRELHPPDHDPVGAAVGRRRRAARADGCSATISA